MTQIHRGRLPGIAVAVLLAATAGPAVAQTPGDATDRVARVEGGILPTVRVKGRAYSPATIEDRMRHYGVPAVSVAVIHDGRIEWARAYGLADVAAGRPATPETLFQAASMSKPVAAMAALRLVEEGKLALDEDVNAKLRSWRVPPSELTATRPVTLRGLLTHGAGLTVHGFPGYAAGRPLPTVAQVLDGEAPANTAPVRVDLEPGTRWRYSGGGTTVMQLLLTEVTGVPFPELMRRVVLDPIGMSASTYRQPLPDSLATRAATAYRADGAAVEGRYHTYPEMAAAGLWTTPSDLARWILEVQRTLAGDPGRVLSRRMAEEMLVPGVGGHGLGPAIQGAGDSLVFQHGGSNAGYRGQFFGFARRGEGVVVMTNSDAGSALASEIAHALSREYGWPGFAAREIVPVPVAPEVLRGYRGSYSRDGAPTPVSVSLEGGTLFLTMPGGERRELVPTDTDAFADAPSGATVRFERDAGGAVAAIVGYGERRLRTP